MFDHMHCNLKKATIHESMLIKNSLLRNSYDKRFNQNSEIIFRRYDKIISLPIKPNQPCPFRYSTVFKTQLYKIFIYITITVSGYIKFYIKRCLLPRIVHIFASLSHWTGCYTTYHTTTCIYNNDLIDEASREDTKIWQHCITQCLIFQMKPVNFHSTNLQITATSAETQQGQMRRL